MSVASNTDSNSANKPFLSLTSPGSNNGAGLPNSPQPAVTPVMSPTQQNIIFFLIGGIGILLWLFLILIEPGSFKNFFEIKEFIPLISLTIAATACNWFPFRVPPQLYVTLSMLLYFAAFLLYPATLAAIVPFIASIIFELYIARRGVAYAARTCGMYVTAIIAAQKIYVFLGGGAIQSDLTFELFFQVIIAFIVFRLINEFVISLTQYMQGYGAWAFTNHIWTVSATYLACLPASLILAAQKTTTGPILFAFGCIIIVVAGYILSKATSSREHERQQFDTVRQLNQKLAVQNDRQQALGNRINQTLDSFLTLVRDYAETSQEQEAAVMDITSTIEQLSRTASQIAGAADNVANAAERAMEAADSGQQSVNMTIEAITEVRNKVREIASKISDLTDKAERIGEIVTVINSIAGEIRLLALNATIEASGAGQFGKRFAIVANEVNQLADRSREALQQIKQIISEIQVATIGSRRVTEDGLQRMEKSVSMASRSEQANREIISVVQKTAQAAAAISLATQQQRSASEQVVTSVHDVAVMIGQNADKVASVSVASMELQRVARELTNNTED